MSGKGYGTLSFCILAFCSERVAPVAATCCVRAPDMSRLRPQRVADFSEICLLVRALLRVELLTFVPLFQETKSPSGYLLKRILI